mgnify:CR=1 FL=1
MEFRAITVNQAVRVREIAGVRIPYPGYVNLLDYADIEDVRKSIEDGELRVYINGGLLLVEDEFGGDLTIGGGLIHVKNETYGELTPERLRPIEHIQTIPQTPVIITHNLGRLPVVEVTDLFGVKISVCWEKVDNNRIRVQPGVPIAFIALMY